MPRRAMATTRRGGQQTHGAEYAAPAGPTPGKAREILKDGEVHGKGLTVKQRGFMGARAAGKPVKKGKGKRGSKT
jgi:hypothetical protein